MTSNGHPGHESTPTPEVVVRRTALSQLRAGDVGVIQDKKLADDDRAVLRAMGLSCNATVKLCRAGEPCIVAVMTAGGAGGRLGASACRIGLARALADKIVVDVVADA